ncbi:MAG: response regulator [Deltaproteobacteria bacterium]|nr:response regulator [Deltaproteobacteria bacterium]
MIPSLLFACGIFPEREAREGGISGAGQGRHEQRRGHDTMIFSYRTVFQGTVVAVLLIFGIVTGSFLINREYRHHLETMRQVHDDYVALRKAEVRTIVDQLVETIKFHKAGVEARLKQNIVDKVRMAVDTAAAIYESEKGRRSEDEIKKLIINTLMPLRFFDGRGYYWIHDTNHRLVAHPFRPFSVGTDDSGSVDSNGQFLIQNFVSTALAHPEGGFVSYYWSKPDVDEREHVAQGREKIAYLQLFEPLGWVIGVGEYLDDVDAEAREEMIRRIALVRYGEVGYIFNHDRKGVCLNHINEDVIGRNRWELLDAAGTKIVQELDRTGRQPGGGFLEYYASADPRTGMPSKKLSFIRSVDGWGWVLGGGVYLEDLDARLAELQADMGHRLREKIVFTVLALIAAVALILFVFHRLMGWFSREINSLVTSEEGGEIAPIDLDRLRIAELREIAAKSNRILAQKAQAQAQLSQAQKMEAVGLLAGGVAHDFNNLLQAMGGNVELLLQGKAENHSDVPRLQKLIVSMDRAAQLVRQLLVFGRKTESRKVRIDLNHEVEDVALMLGRTIPKMVSLKLDLDPDLRFLQADPVQIEQVLLNLANNSVDAMPDGGRLTIGTGNEILDEEFVRLHPGAGAGPHVRLTVSDTGCGMDRDIQDHVFDPFFTTKEVGKGTGLGLASVYGIVRAHGGYILCESAPGRGTTFTILLPSEETGDGLETTEPGDASAEGRGEIVLVVDDEPEIRDLTRESLVSLGYEVVVVASGEEALRVYEQNGRDIDLILLDLNMPGMGGGKCLQRLKGINPQVRVVVATGYGGGEHAEEARASGARGYLPKPYRIADLAATVRRVLDEER